MSLWRLLTLLLVLSSNSAFGYEQATHAHLTSAAFDISALADSSVETPALVRRLGLDNYAPLGSGEGYFEFLGNLAGLVAIDRSAQLYEKKILVDLHRDGESPLKTWLMYGAIREDDNPSEDPPTPQDVAPGMKRPLNHFYDPRFDRPLTFPGLAVIDSDVHKNPDWAIGSRNSFFDPNTPEFPRRNSYSVFDAREAMFRALTLLSYDGTVYHDLGGDDATRQRWRRAYWATAFRALGNVLHLNQDMAQPQHTRNESHSGIVCPGVKICVTGHTSVYEKYINARTLLARSFSSGAPSGTIVPLTPTPLAIAPYPVPAFSRYTDYWSTSPGPGSSSGKGLADYSNRGFFTAAKNLGASEYAAPSNDPADYSIRSFVPSRWDGTPAADTTPAHVYYGSVDDSLLQAKTTDVALTTYSLWDQFLLTQSAAPAYSLNRVNYDAMANLLVPRAVGYSAGLINYFFRGRIDIDLPDEGVFALADHASDDGFTMVRAKVRNATPAFVDPNGASQAQRMGGGQFFAIVRYHRDSKYVASLDTVVGTEPCAETLVVIDAANPDASTACRDGIERILVSRPLYGTELDAGEQKLLEFEFEDAPIPFGMTDVALQIVYRGEIGGEADAVAVGTIDVSEPTYFTYQNASDYIHLGGHVYTRGEIDADSALLGLVQPRSCVDYQRSPPRLRDECLNPFALDLRVGFADLQKPLVIVTGLPNRRLIRFVYLTVGDEGFNPPGLAKAARTLTINAHRRGYGDGEKASLYQDGTCLPHDPFDIPPRRSQLFMTSRTQGFYALDSLRPLRGVNGWYNASCVVDGDNGTSGTSDDRVQAMTPLTPLTEEVQPYPVTIMAEYL